MKSHRQMFGKMDGAVKATYRELLGQDVSRERCELHSNRAVRLIAEDMAELYRIKHVATWSTTNTSSTW